MWFEGTPAQAISESRRTLKPLVVLLTGFDDASRAVQDALIEQDGEKHLAGSIALVLEDDLANTDRSQFTDAKNFRAFCPVEALPTVVMVSPGGATLAKVVGAVPASELRSQLAAAFAAHQRQQQQLLAAQAALAAMAAAGTPAAASVVVPAASLQAIDESELADMPPLEGEEDQAPTAAAAAAAPAAAAPAAMAEDDLSDMPPLEGDEPAVQPPAAPAAAAPAPAAAAPAAAAAAAAPQEEDLWDMPPLEDLPPLGPQGAAGAARRPAAAVAGAAVQQVQRDPAQVPYQLRFRFTDGSSFQADFSGATRLADVFAAVDAERAARGARQLAYLLVQASPRVLAGAGAEGLTLAELGIQPRTSLQVVPHAAHGHQPPAPPEPEQTAEPKPAAEAAEAADAAEPMQVEQEAAGAAAEPQAAAAAPAAAQAAAAEPMQPPPPAEVALQVRLSNGDSLRRAFQPGATLAAVLDWVDGARTDRGAYKLVQPHPRRTFFSGDLDKSLQELGFAERSSLQLELLPPAAKKPKFVVAGAPAVQAAAAAAAAEGPPSPRLPTSFVLRFKLLDGQQLRGSFPPEAVLQEVCHYLDTHRTDGGAPYTLVLPFPKRRFGPADMQQPLVALGLHPRQLLLLEPAAAPPRGWSLGGALSAAASWLNPYSYITGPAGTPSDGSGHAAAGGGSGSGGQQGRPGGGTAGGGGGANIHTLHGSSSGSGGGAGQQGGDPDGNSYWNGNSTEFGAGPPPGQQ